MQEHHIQIDDISLHYRVTGQGDPVLLIHGFSEDGQVWNDMLPTLSGQYRLIVPDLAGSGKSGGNIDGLTLEDHAEHLLKLMEQEQISNCAMIGHSMGGYITLAFAEKYPERLNKFGLFHSTAYADNEEKKRQGKRMQISLQRTGPRNLYSSPCPTFFHRNIQRKIRL